MISQQRITSATHHRRTPKTAASRRTIALDKTTVRLLRLPRRLQAHEVANAGHLWFDTGYAFTNPYGQPLSPTSSPAGSATSSPSRVCHPDGWQDRRGRRGARDGADVVRGVGGPAPAQAEVCLDVIVDRCAIATCGESPIGVCASPLIRGGGINPARSDALPGVLRRGHGRHRSRHPAASPGDGGPHRIHGRAIRGSALVTSE
jgi:hypothetical protein